MKTVNDDCMSACMFVRVCVTKKKTQKKDTLHLIMIVKVCITINVCVCRNICAHPCCLYVCVCGCVCTFVCQSVIWLGLLCKACDHTTLKTVIR